MENMPVMESERILNLQRAYRKEEDILSDKGATNIKPAKLPLSDRYLWDSIPHSMDVF